MSLLRPDAQNDGAVNCCWIFLVFLVTTLGSCEFIEFQKLAGNNLTLNGVLSSNLAAEIPDMATFGILQWSPDASGCRKYDNITELLGAYLAAQVGGAVFGSYSSYLLNWFAAILFAAEFW